MTFPVIRSYTTFAEMLHATQSLIILCSYVTFPRTLEEVPDNEHLQCSHTNHHGRFDEGEVEYSPLRAADSIKVSVFSRPEVFLHPADCAQLPTDLKHQIFKLSMLFGSCSGFLREERGRSVVGAFDGNLEVDELVGEGGHGVGETEGIGAGRLRSEDEIALPFFLTGHNLLIVGTDHIVVNVKGAS
jgi:hypothetical protein